jgi:hypothetical protein
MITVKTGQCPAISILLSNAMRVCKMLHLLAHAGRTALAKLGLLGLLLVDALVEDLSVLVLR